MANRFERLFQLPERQYTEGAPIILAAGVLSKDTETGSIIAQLKFQSVSEKRIKAVKVSLAAYDVSKAEVQGVTDYQYLELNISNGQEFGSNKAVVMPVTVTRSFTISSLLVVFNDGSMWESSGDFSVLPTTKALSLGGVELEKQYLIATNDSAAYTPTENQDLWQCACGTWNKGTTCTHCCILKRKVFSALDVATLTEQVNIRLAAEAEERRIATEREEAQQAERVAKNKKIAKKLKLAATIVIPLLVIVLLFTQWLLPDVINPAIAYAKAENLLSAGQYDEAEAAFDALGDYRDSTEMVLESRYQKACWLMSEGDYDSALAILYQLGNYDGSTERIAEIIEQSKNAAYISALALFDNAQYPEAIAAFESLGDYQDSHARVKEAKYQYARSLFAEFKYAEAIVIFEALGDYLDSSACAVAAKYFYAKALFEKSQYVDAKEVFSQIPSYADCTDMIKECDYQQACTYYASASYKEALNIFESISGYKDTLDKIPKCKYEIACKYLSEENYEGAIALFKNLSDYLDSQQKVTECTYLQAKHLIDAGEYNKATAQLSTISNYKDSAKYMDTVVLCGLAS